MAYPLAKGKKVMLEGAPYWYGTHMNKLDFEWSLEEEQELERYCEKILRNIEEEEMSPRDRWLAHMHAKLGDIKNADRKLMVVSPCVVFPTRTLDSYGDMLRPIDLYKSPKLLVKGSMATVARFKLDYACWANIAYGEDIWGGRGKMVDYGNPCPIGDPPVKTMKDLEKIEVPDPLSAGLFPGYLWANREMRRILTKYNIPMAMFTSFCPGASEIAQQSLLGWTQFQVALRKDPELVHACCNKAHQYNIRFGRAMIDACEPEGQYCCQFTGGFPMKGNEWIADLWLELAKDLKAYSMTKPFYKNRNLPIHLSHGYSWLSGIKQWYEIGWERGNLRPDAFDGGTGGDVTDAKRDEVEDLIIKFHGEHNLYTCVGILTAALEKGPASLIEEEAKRLADKMRPYRKVSVQAVAVYFCTQPNLDVAVAAMKKYMKL